MKRTVLTLALFLILPSCTSKDGQETTEPVAEPAVESASAEVPAAAKESPTSESSRLDQTFHALLPRDTHAFAYIPSLARAEQSLGWTQFLLNSFSPDRRGLRSLAALESTGFDLSEPDSWTHLGLSATTGLVLSLVDQNTMVLGLKTNGLKESLPKIEMVLTLLTGQAPKKEELEGGRVKLNLRSPKAWLLAEDNWVMMVITKGVEEPTEKALGLSQSPKASLGTNPELEAAFPKENGNTLVHGFVYAAIILEEELQELRAEKHSSWRYAEQLHRRARLENATERVVNHWAAKIEQERAWNKKNKPRMHAVAKVLESTYGGIQSVGFQLSEQPYGLSVDALMRAQDNTNLRTLFPGAHPTRVPNLGSDDIWIATQLNPMALTGLVTHLLPGENKSTLKTLATILGAKSADISLALRATRSHHGLDLKSQILVENLGESKEKLEVKHVEKILTTLGKNASAHLTDNGISIGFGHKGKELSPKQIKKEGTAHLLAHIPLVALLEPLSPPAKTGPILEEDPVKNAIETEIQETRQGTANALREKRKNLLTELGTVSLRVLPAENGWAVRADLLSPGSLSGALKAWATWMKEATEIRDATQESVSEKRRQLRQLKGPEARPYPTP